MSENQAEYNDKLVNDNVQYVKNNKNKNDLMKRIFKFYLVTKYISKLEPK